MCSIVCISTSKNIMQSQLQCRVLRIVFVLSFLLVCVAFHVIPCVVLLG